MDYITTMLNSLNEKDQAKLKKSITWMNETAEAVSVPPPKVKAPAKTSEEKLELEKEKLAKLEKKIEGGKSKTPDVDVEKKAKLEAVIAKLETSSSPPPKEEKPKAVKAVAAKASAVKVVAEKKNLPKLTATMKTQLKTAFEEVKVKWDDSFVEKFTAFLNGMTPENYKLTQYEAHASFYATEQLPIEIITVEELHDQNNDLTELSVGVYQNKSGKRLTGPAEVEGEDFDDPISLGDTKVIVGLDTQRIYENETEEFLGYWGVMKFYEASL